MRLRNSTTATFTFDYDDSAPTVTVTPDRVPDHNGWYNHAVIFDTDGTDATSGIASRDPNQTYNDPDGTGLTVSGQCTDNAGNDRHRHLGRLRLRRQRADRDGHAGSGPGSQRLVQPRRLRHRWHRCHLRHRQPRSQPDLQRS